MAAVSAQDSWDQPSTSSSRLPIHARTRTAVRAAPVPDDWDASDSDQETADEDNQKIWAEANSRAPMPSLVIAPSSTAPSLVSPPLTVFQPPPRILKRPSASTSSSAAELQTHESFLDREAKYQAARERIFGAESREGKDVLRNQRSDTLVPVTNIVRDPHGPDEDSRGFGGRRVHRVLSNSLPRAESEL